MSTKQNGTREDAAQSKAFLEKEEGRKEGEEGGEGRGEPNGLRYTLTQIPPFPVTFFVAFQHLLVSLASALTMSAVISDTLCAYPGHPIRARLFGTTLFMAGVCTICQTIIGVRLPVFQGPSSSFLVPLVAMGRDPQWMCREDPTTAVTNGQGEMRLLNATLESENQTDTLTGESFTIEEKLQQLSGSLMVASMLEVVIGGLGLIKPLLRFIGPLTVAPTIALIGLSLYQLPVIYAKLNPALALGSAILVVFFSLYMSKIQVPIPTCGKGKEKTSLPLFQLLPILLALIVMWILCAILTATDVFPNDPDHPMYFSRTDSKLNIVYQSPWFQFTYPAQFGFPSFNVAASIGFLAAVISSLVESVGDYYAAAKACEVMPPPDHAITRGIFVEGIGSLISGAVGAAHATTSYSGNIAMLTLTKTASRSVLVVAGIALVVLSLVGKVGAALATLPPPILGGILLVVLGMLASLGLSTLKYADMTCNRNLLVIGVAFMSGLSIPSFVEKHGDMIATGNTNADQVIRVVLGTPMFLGGIIALILDNTVPGTDEERGLIQWKQSHAVPEVDVPEQDGTDVTVFTNGHTQVEIEDKSADVLTEDDIYGFRVLKGRFSNSCLLRILPFMPPSIFRRYDREDRSGYQKHISSAASQL